MVPALHCNFQLQTRDAAHLGCGPKGPLGRCMSLLEGWPAATASSHAGAGLHTSLCWPC